MQTLYLSELFERHKTGKHPESPKRIRVLRELLEIPDVLNEWTHKDPPTVERKLIQSIHPEAHIASIEELAERGGGRIDADTVVSADSFEVALHAVGAAVSAVDDIFSRKATKSVCLVRPPGHHCRPAQAMGFCLFGNVAIAAQHALDEYDLNRVLIVDWDVHHGNGTQEIFYDSDRVHFFSAHRFPFYPGTGDSDETGTGKGLGATWNLPLEFGISRKQYHDKFSAMLEQAAQKCRPELILISAGFDAHKDDPIGSLGLETEDFKTLTELLQKTADEYCEGRLVSVLEGGYHLQALKESVLAHLRALE
ncbi:MAG: histone deacetylase [Planctomycetaceae bacterium]|nr:histone deacetylase [Planctomycetaceae bacterium]